MKKIKFYAVRQGREPGIYFSWPDCEEQVKGYPNAEYKSFDDPKAAEDYLSDVGLLKVEDLCLNEVLVAYTDGSYIDGCSGYGAVFVYNGQVIGKLCGYIENPISRNVTGELQAVVAAIKTAQARGCTEIVICHDLMGIQMWGDQLWERNKVETQEFSDFIAQKRAEGMAIGFGWMHGHKGNPFNELADKCAKEGAISKKKKAAGFPLGKEPFFSKKG